MRFGNAISSVNTVQNGGVIVRENSLDVVTSVTLGPYDVSQFAGLSIGLQSSGNCTAVLTWYDNNSFVSLGYSQWDLAKDLDGYGCHQLADVASNLGPQVTLTIIGTVTVTNLYVVPIATPVVRNAQNTLGAIIQASNVTVADGTNAVSSARYVMSGPAELSLVCEYPGKNWELQLYYVAADGTTHLIVSHVGNTKDYQIGLSLPLAGIVAKFYNNAGDGTSQIVEINVIQGAGGGSNTTVQTSGGGGGNTQFALLTNAVIVPNPTIVNLPSQQICCLGIAGTTLADNMQLTIVGKQSGTQFYQRLLAGDIRRSKNGIVIVPFTSAFDTQLSIYASALDNRVNPAVTINLVGYTQNVSPQIQHRLSTQLVQTLRASGSGTTNANFNSPSAERSWVLLGIDIIYLGTVATEFQVYGSGIIADCIIQPNSSVHLNLNQYVLQCPTICFVQASGANGTYYATLSLISSLVFDGSDVLE